jgi:hypothetical protein
MHPLLRLPSTADAADRTSSGGRSGAAIRPLAASSWRSMRFLYSMSRREPTMALLSLPAMAVWKSAALLFSSCVCFWRWMRSSGTSSGVCDVTLSVARSVAASPNFLQLARRSCATCG